MSKAMGRKKEEAFKRLQILIININQSSSVANGLRGGEGEKEREREREREKGVQLWDLCCNGLVQLLLMMQVSAKASSPSSWTFYMSPRYLVVRHHVLWPATGEQSPFQSKHSALSPLF